MVALGERFLFSDSVSAGSGGVRVGGGGGPVGGSVGRGGVYVNAGAGPFWLGGKRSFSGTTPYRRVSLNNHYEKYRAQMKGAGVQKRNRSGYIFTGSII